jgi:hypothetical protein
MEVTSKRTTKFVLGSMRGIGTSPRPGCRRMIIRHQLRPYIDRFGRWDGFSGLRPDGHRCDLSEGMAREMGKMLREGFWPELLDPELNRRAQEARRDSQRQARLWRRTNGL